MTATKVTATVKIIDLGADRLVKSLRERPAIEFGVLGSKGAAKYPGSPYTVAEVASVHEFGSKNVPERSFLRGWFDAEEAKHKEFIRKLTTKFLELKITTQQFVSLAGEYAVGGIQKRIAQKIPPPLAQSTLWKRWGRKKVYATTGPRNAKVKPGKTKQGKPKRVFGDTPLIDTGTLRSSLTYRLYKP